MMKSQIAFGTNVRESSIGNVYGTSSGKCRVLNDNFNRCWYEEVQLLETVRKKNSQVMMLRADSRKCENQGRVYSSVKRSSRWKSGEQYDNTVVL